MNERNRERLSFRRLKLLERRLIKVYRYLCQIVDASANAKSGVRVSKHDGRCGE